MRVLLGILGLVEFVAIAIPVIIFWIWAHGSYTECKKYNGAFAMIESSGNHITLFSCTNMRASQ